MELAQAKIPYLPPEWTLARAAKYAAKLGVFILVPGLHQIACKRWILGSLLLILYVVSEFVGLNSPFEIMYVDRTPYSLFDNLSEAAQNISWLLLAFDLKKLDRRYLTPGHLLPAACVAVLSYMPFHDNRILFIHVEQENTVCPAFCKYDIVEWDFLDFDVEKVSIGDYVVLGGFRGPFYTTKILEGPAKDVCASGRIKAWRLPGDNRFCTKWKNDSGEYVHLYDFLIPGLGRNLKSHERTS